ncbi:hypothetical protein LJC71_02570 [Desulfosarcina sp. OttesenSCG-928-A07]|nr:hypothetical protein [Desulfosarcina sp. OttesenSCG-928-G17]MDL2328621.1 hypothetical protein [Desulfosarcina sp. OttesenSCG-928-A07]
MNLFSDSVLRLLEMPLIAPYRWVDNPVAGFFIGTMCLAMMTVMLGEVVISISIRLNRSHLNTLTRNIVHHETLSMQAYAEGDKTSYKALNQVAHDAWGKHFFTMVAYSAGMLSPVPFALAWMQHRFHDVDFIMGWPLHFIFGQTVSYVFIFILLYILCRVLFKYLRPYLPYFKNVQKMLDAAGGTASPTQPVASGAGADARSPEKSGDASGTEPVAP